MRSPHRIAAVVREVSVWSVVGGLHGVDEEGRAILGIFAELRRNPMGEGIQQQKSGERGVPVNVRLNVHDQSNQPLLVNVTQVGVAQGLAYLDFGFVEPALLAAVAHRAQQGEATATSIEGRRAARVALSLETLVRLQQQVQQVLSRLQPRPAKIS